MAEQLGRYEVLERLGRGGMAEVYRAHQKSLDRYVAIKILHAFLAEDEEFRERFEKEARNIAKLKHPHIVQVYDFDYAPKRDSYYMVMELIEGETLKDRIHDFAQKGKKLSIDEVLRYIKEAASALAYAHKSGMIHRDVKPANLMIDKENRVVLTDFGIAKMLDSKQLTVSGGMIGTPAYMSPEQGLGEQGDERSDLYSLGVIMYQLLVGDLPYDAETALGVILMHVNDPIPDVRAFDADIPDGVQNIVNKAMAKDPEKRYQTADEIIADIERYERGQADAIKPFYDSDIKTLEQKDDSIAFETVDKVAPSDTRKVTINQTQTKPQRRGYWGILAVVILIAVITSGYFYANQQGLLPAVLAFNSTSIPTNTPTNTPTPSDTPTAEPSNTPNLLGSATAAAQIILSQTPNSTATPSETPSLTYTPDVEPSNTPKPTETLPPSETPNATQTAEILQTQTIAACTFDYAIVAQTPADGEDGGFFRVNEPYTREITLLNTGTCPWGENTSLTFVSGEDFNAGPRIFIRDSVQVGEEYTLSFEGTTPARGSVDPIVGTWQLRTRGQREIGDPIEIQVMVFDPGT